MYYVKIKNIKITDAYIEADYIPECSSECGHIKMNRVTKEIDVRSVIVLATHILYGNKRFRKNIIRHKKDPSYTIE